MAVILAVLGVLLVSSGAVLWSPPVGLAVAGGQCIAAAYVVSYLKARTR